MSRLRVASFDSYFPRDISAGAALCLRSDAVRSRLFKTARMGFRFKPGAAPPFRCLAAPRWRCDLFEFLGLYGLGCSLGDAASEFSSAHLPQDDGDHTCAGHPRLLFGSV